MPEPLSCYDWIVDIRMAEYCWVCDEPVEEEPFEWVRKWKYKDGYYEYVRDCSTAAVVNGYH
jgi:hypothetical protein